VKEHIKCYLKRGINSPFTYVMDISLPPVGWPQTCTQGLDVSHERRTPYSLTLTAFTPRLGFHILVLTVKVKELRHSHNKRNYK
jgi:hypothetical protein